MMDLILDILNIIIPPLSLTTLLFILPSYLFFKFILSTLSSFFSEDVAGKVVLITGASSGIGEHLAYEYAKRGACLALVARRENRLRDVAQVAMKLGSPGVIVVRGDVSRVEDCRRFVDEAVNHFGRLDHLVTNAGVTPVVMFEDYDDITNSAPAMDINFWGSVYSTHFAIPHLRNSKGKIIAITSSAGWLRAPRMSFYCASKSAIIAFYETLRVELGTDIGITIVTPGLIESEMTQGKFLSKEGKLELNQATRDVEMNLVPVTKVERGAKAIVKGACRGDKYLTEPAWIKMSFYWNAFCPEILEELNRWFLMVGPGTSEREALGKQILDFTGAKKILYPESIQSLEIKGN